MNVLALLPLLKGLHVSRQRMALSALLAAQEKEDDPLSAWLHRAAVAWEHDMQAAARAAAAALHDGSVEALAGMRRLLPGLLREANEAPQLATVLYQAMALSIVADPSLAIASADLGISEEPIETEVLRHWRAKEIFPTDMGSADLRGFSRWLLNRSIFSARTTNAEYLGEIANVTDQILGGHMDMATGRLRLMKKLKAVGYDSEKGFPSDMANVPPAERGSLQDISSEQRLNLVLETNVSMAQGAAQEVNGNSDRARFAFPAYELVRHLHRHTPRGTPDEKGHVASPGWEKRWSDAGESVGWQGALKSPMIALKDSPIWQALGDGAGGYADTLGNAYEPYAFRSGYGRNRVARKRVIELGLIEGDRMPAAKITDLTPPVNSAQRAFQKLPADMKAEALRALGLL